MNTYTYTGSLFDITTVEQLADEGILDGPYGKLNFKRCSDGYAIYDTSFIGSGFVSTPTSANIAFPNYINGIPVTEIHNSIKIRLCDYREPIVIEGRNIKRAYLSIGRKRMADEPYIGNSTERLAMALFDAMDNDLAKYELLNISVSFCKGGEPVDLCEITCNDKCMLGYTEAKKLDIIAPSVVLTGNAHSSLEYLKVSGRIYPHRYSDWDGDIQETDYFKNAKNLKFVEGSLCGDICWSFKGCTSLESVHFANGMKVIPEYSFAGCSSLKDLYVPDTVSKIGAYAFEGCTKLASIHLPSDIRKISKGLFKNCSSLGKCYLSDTVEEIEDEAFSGCTSLRKPWIPKGIKKISQTAFDNPAWAKIF